MVPLVILALLVAGYAFFHWHQRQSERHTKSCPRCGEPMEEMTRSFHGGAIEYFYQCNNPDCLHREGA